MMKFAGRVWQEGNEMRGKVEFLAEDGGKPNESHFFQSFDELKQILTEKHEASQITEKPA